MNKELSLNEIYHQYMYSYPHKTAYRPLDGSIAVKDYFHFLQDRDDNTLYFHIPFCEAKCGYCNLFSITQSANYINDYANALLAQAKASKIRAHFADFVMGGGTPLLLSESQLSQLFEAAELLGVNHSHTYSIVETSPQQATTQKLQLLKSFNVNRISIGIQSFVESELKALKRPQSVQAIETALQQIRKLDFDCMNADLIYGIPEQTIDSLKYSLDHLLQYSPEELFVYPLYIRKHTAIAALQRNPATYEMYLFARDYLLSLGYTQLSMRKFSKNPPNYASCGFGQTISFGCGGRSYIDALHYCSKYSTKAADIKNEIDAYIKNPSSDAQFYGVILNADEQKRRFVIKQLLHTHGVNNEEYFSLFKEELCASFPFLNEWVLAGYITKNKEWTRLTELGLSLSDYLGAFFISDDIQKLMNTHE